MTQNLDLDSDSKGSQIQICITIEPEAYGCEEFKGTLFLASIEL
jgi:hypothetical protein